MRKSVVVWVQEFTDRQTLQLQWHDRRTGKRMTRSTRTDDPELAEAARLILEHELNNGGGTAPEERPKIQPPFRYGCVYLVEGEPGVYKIGKALRPKFRVKDLNVGNSRELELIHCIHTDDTAWLESLWHEKFAGRRKRGEWFALEPSDVQRFTRVALWSRGCAPVYGVTIIDPWYSVS